MVVQRHGAGRAGAIVSAALVGGVIAGAAGCGGNSAGVASGGSAADPAAQVRNAADRLVEAGSSSATTSMEMATGGTRITIRGQGTYDFRRRTGQLTVVLPKDAAGETDHQPITELLAPGALYMKNRGAGVPADKWVRVDTAALADGNLVTGGATDPYAAAELLRGAQGVTYVGEEHLAGVKVRHYRGSAVLPAKVAKGFSKGAVPFDAYLDEAGRLCKVRQQFIYVNGGRPVAVASTTLLYGFGAAVSVRLPDARDIFDGKIQP
uniref:Lipoprotein n=1 Tax=Streptomyces sp. NBC_00003 TaxID=2903608 RepID=A0AAU2V599_9ACTN